ncbi:hypothetical protein QJS10_CPB19g01593 [Acorus calamus]|uniref:Dynein light chain n=1 Tax=Acorus calamus TaxID=4465 RepID=A0AAV9CJC9_ACOCL|nr:hypothetical protein QJS10_CPB19g01593 [Acorus calamus]
MEGDGGASEELERRSRYLSELIQKQKLKAAAPVPVPEAAEEEEVHKIAHRPPRHHNRREEKEEKEEKKEKEKVKVKEEVRRREPPSNVRVRASDMPIGLQQKAFRCARESLASMPKLDSKRLALSLKKEFDSSYGPAWHCIVGTSFGSYVTHSLGGFLYFSIDKVYILLFKTAVEPLE